MRSLRNRSTQGGVAAIEFAFVMLFGLLPLLWLTFTGVMVFAAKQSLALASMEGARAALRYGDPLQRRMAACTAAQHAMQWLLDFAGQSVDCSSPAAAGVSVGVSVSSPYACDAQTQCLRVVASYDYAAHPFLPMPGWSLDGPLNSSAVVRLDNL